MRTRLRHGLNLLLTLALVGCTQLAAESRPESPATAAVSEPQPLPDGTQVPGTTTAPSTPWSTAPESTPQAANTPAPAAQQAALPADSIWVFAGDRLVAAGQSGQVINLAHELQHTRIAQLDAAPDGSLLVFTSGGLYAVDPSSGAERMLMERQGWTANSPHFSPDGRLVTFTIGNLQRWELLALDVASDHINLLQQGQGNEFLLPIGWTAGGIVVESGLYGTDAGPQSLALLDPASGRLQQLRSAGHRSAVPAPDGSKVAISGGSHVLGEPQASSWLLLLDTATGAEVLLAPETPGWFSHLSWSPDGQSLLYLSAPTTMDEPDTIHVISPGQPAYSIGLAELGLAGTLRDARWRDARTVLLLLAGQAGQLRVYELALSQPVATGLRELTALRLAARRDQLAQMIYVPRR